MNKATATIKALSEALSNCHAGDHEKRTAVTIGYSALQDIYGRETASAVLWAVAETCHHTGHHVSPSVVDRITELTA